MGVRGKEATIPRGGEKRGKAIERRAAIKSERDSRGRLLSVKTGEEL